MGCSGCKGNKKNSMSIKKVLKKQQAKQQVKSGIQYGSPIKLKGDTTNTIYYPRINMN